MLPFELTKIGSSSKSDRAQQLSGGMGHTLLSGGLREPPGVTLYQIEPRNGADYQRSDVNWVLDGIRSWLARSETKIWWKSSTSSP
jgi:hypothetical protein